MSRLIGFAACSVLTVSAVPGFAQSNTNVDRHPSYSAANVVTVYDAALSARYDDVTLPANVTVTSMYLPLVLQMIDRSQTFRRQCARVAAAARSLTIDIRSGSSSPGRRAPAWSTIHRQPGGGLQAVVSVTPGGRLSELIAHEIEHVIEQIDGIDLTQKSRVGASGVRACDCGDFDAFETTRAIHTGQKVAREMAGRSP
jgi:hypothetical protein